MPPIALARMVVVPFATSNVPPPAPRVMLVDKLKVAVVVASVPAVVASPRVSPPVPRLAPFAMLTVLPPVTVVPPE